jgi:hypothetical protein
MDYRTMEVMTHKHCDPCHVLNRQLAIIARTPQAKVQQFSILSTSRMRDFLDKSRKRTISPVFTRK